MDKLRYGIIGTGERGRSHVRTVGSLPEVEIVALADSSPASLESARADCPQPETVRLYEDYHELLANPSIDAVVITTPNHTHAEVTAAAMEAGKHIYLEKPLAHTPEDAARIVRLAQGYNKVIWNGLQMRNIPALVYLQQEIEAGACGDIKMLTLTEHRPPFLDKVGHWNRFNRYSGGTLVEKCCHVFDLFNWLAGNKPVRVYASGGADVAYKNESYDGEQPDILDNAFVIVDYEGGQRAMLDLCMFHTSTRTHPEIGLSVTGDQGYAQFIWPYEATVEDFETRSIKRFEAEGRSTVTGAPGHGGADLPAQRAFADCLLNNGRPAVDVETAALAVYVGAAAERSVQEKRAIDLAEILP